MPLYFAYGSNMERGPMAERCPQSRAVGPARLIRHRFIVSVDGYGSVVRDPQRHVWGVLWELALADVPRLDRYESLSTGLYTKVLQPVLSGKGPRQAIVYVGRSAKPGIPKAGYMEGVVEAASHAGLPQDYIRELTGWVPRAGPQSETVKRAAVRPLWTAPGNSSLSIRAG